MKSIDPKYAEMDDFALADEMAAISRVSVPRAVDELRAAEIRHTGTCAVEEMPDMVRAFLGI